jgi:hypothetical protein
MGMRAYTPREVAEFTGTSVPLVKRWADTGLIVPDIGRGGEKGIHRRYSFRNVFEVAVAQECHKFQLPTPTTKEILKRLRIVSARTSVPPSFLDLSYEDQAAFLCWDGYLRFPDDRPSPFTAILIYSPGLRPKLLAGPSILFASPAGYAVLVIPIHDLLMRLERETGDRFTPGAYGGLG